MTEANENLLSDCGDERQRNGGTLSVRPTILYDAMTCRRELSGPQAIIHPSCFVLSFARISSTIQGFFDSLFVIDALISEPQSNSCGSGRSLEWITYCKGKAS